MTKDNDTAGAAGIGLASGRLNAVVGARALHLRALDGLIAAQAPKLACGLVCLPGGSWVVNVISVAHPARSVDVGCDLLDGVWWFVLVKSTLGPPPDERLMPVEQIPDAVERLVRLLTAEGGEG